MVVHLLSVWLQVVPWEVRRCRSQGLCALVIRRQSIIAAAMAATMQGGGSYGGWRSGAGGGYTLRRQRREAGITVEAVAVVDTI
jgi:hypothetical protein